MVATDPAGHPLTIPFNAVAAAIGAASSGATPTGLAAATGLPASTVAGGAVPYMPVTLGNEPPTFVTDGAGRLMMVAFTP
jgi:hypothetical protein